MRNKKNMVIGLLCVALVFMGIGYSIFNSTLNISGTATSSGSFDVKITNVVLKEKSTKVTDTTEYKANNDYGTVANLSATFNEPTDYITYTITVSNLGSIDALISVTTNPQTDEKNNFKMSCDAVNRTELPARTGTTEFDCTMIFDEGKNLTTITGEENASLTVTVDAVQKSTYQISYVDQDDSCFVSFIDGQINYYDTSKEGCGTTVEIPNNLRLKKSEVTNLAFNNQVCMAFAPGLNSNHNVTDEQFCAGLEQQISGMSNEEVLSTMYAAFVTPTYEEPSGEYHVIDTIGAGVFTVKNLTSVSMSDNENIIAIGDAAFTSNALQSVVLPTNIQTIGNYAFVYNQLSGTLRIPSSLVSIGSDAFNNAGQGNSGNSIQSIVFEKGSHLQTISDHAFDGNKLSGALTIPSSVTSIGKSAFYGNQINTLNIGSGLTFLGSKAFSKNYNNTTSSYTLQEINIDMTESTWNSRGLPTSGWYDGNVTPTYKQE